MYCRPSEVEKAGQVVAAEAEADDGQPVAPGQRRLAAAGPPGQQQEQRQREQHAVHDQRHRVDAVAVGQLDDDRLAGERDRPERAPAPGRARPARAGAAALRCCRGGGGHAADLRTVRSFQAVRGAGLSRAHVLGPRWKPSDAVQPDRDVERVAPRSRACAVPSASKPCRHAEWISAEHRPRRRQAGCVETLLEPPERTGAIAQQPAVGDQRFGAVVPSSEDAEPVPRARPPPSLA